MTPSSTHYPIEIGFILAGELDAVDSAAIDQSRQLLLDSFRNTFPQFKWSVDLAYRQELIDARRIEPMVLMDLAREERDGRSWDFVFAITAADLITHYKPFAFAVISRAVDTAVISTARIDPRMDDPHSNRDERIACLSRRLATLVRHAMGQLLALEKTHAPDNIMCEIQTLEDLDRLRDAGLTPDQHEELGKNLEMIADIRLEEVHPPGVQGVLGFYLKSCWLNWHEVRDAIWQARPWEFPRRLNRLTTAAFSAAAILLVTAESWELATHQSVWSLVVFILGSLVVTTWYIAQRQQLLVRRERRISEQSVLTNVSAVGIVLLGMLATFAVTLSIVLVVCLLLFRRELVGNWTGLDARDVGWADYGSLAVFVTSLALMVGALGASFEEQYYFRHITFVDEEI